MKWVIVIIVSVVGYMIYSGNMGGAREATKNYNKVMQKGGSGEVRPSPMHEYIKNKKKGSLY